MADPDDVGLRLEPAAPLRLHPARLRRTDSNSPLLRAAGRTLCFVSHYQPRGHTLRSVEAGARWPRGAFEPVRLVDDPAPEIGKWIQSVWRDPAGDLYGWYHAEEAVPASGGRLFLPHLGALRSEDEGGSWRLLGPLLQAGAGEVDPGYRNGFLAGGYGDFCTIADRAGRWFYLHLSSYGPEEPGQGVGVLRYPIAARAAPRGLELWQSGGWRPLVQGARLRPIFGVRRGWRHRDPAAWWGPAVHYNRFLERYVMLLNWTEGGDADIVQRGVFISFNADLAEPTGWSSPRLVVRDGSWYPQLIGEGPDEGDTLAGAAPRFFMSGYSAWTVRFSRAGPLPAEPPSVTRGDFAALFGTAPW